MGRITQTLTDMLSRITIRNLVIVKSLDLEFSPGMTALTGETGAGKSILIDALGLALGDKADSGLIGAGADRAEISVSFDLGENSPAHAWLAENDLDDDDCCLIRRVLTRNGRSRAYVNGSPTPLAALRSLGEQLVDIHSQHAHQALLRPSAQRELLDAYGGLRAAVEATAVSFADWQACLAAHRQLQQASADRAARLDYLQFQLAELDDLPCLPEQIAELEAEHGRLAHAERLLSDTASVLNALSDDEQAVDSVLSSLMHTLTELAGIDPELEEPRALLEQSAIQIDEAISGLRHYQDRIDLDPDRLSEIDTTLGRVHEAARKHRIRADELGALQTRLRAEAESLADADNNLQQLAEQQDKTETAYRAAAAKLSKARTAAAKKLATTVTQSMQTLGMKGGRFDVSCRRLDEKPGANGVDRIGFDVAANPGQRAGALSDVASGGELSRISLAIQVATANCAQVPSLIFDEVDVGIGGATAEVVGQLLRRLGEQRQVLCVTHLPQVAAQAHQQLRVIKTTDGETTETRIDRLADAERIDEIARMLGGVSITEKTRRHADEMIRQAQG